MKKNLYALAMSLIVMLLLTPVGSLAQTMLTLNSNTTMYGVFQKAGPDFLGKTQLNSNPLQFTTILDTNQEPSIGNINCAAYVDGVIYTLYANPVSFDYTHRYEMRQFDAQTGQQLGKMTEVSPIYVSESQATDPLTGRSWGRFAGNVAGDRWEIAWVDYRTMERHAVGQARRTYICMGMTTAQELYAVGKDGWLYQVSTEDGSDMPIGPLGIDNYIDESQQLYHMNGAINPEDNRFYMTFADNDQNCSLLSIDLTTGKATQVAAFAEPTLGLVVFFPENNAENGTPAASTDIATDFDSQTLTGHVSFTLPTLTYDGQPLLTSLSYEVRADGRQVATGQGQPGQRITTTAFTFQQEGMHGLEIIAANDAGTGAHAFHTFYVGVDTPAPPTDIQATLNPNTGSVSLTWTPPTGINNGYLGTITYTITRYPDAQVVATGLTTTAYTDQLIPERDMEGFTYGIKASNSQYTGEEGISPKVVYGASLDVPYKAMFTPDDMRLYTLIDATGDGKSFASQYAASTKVYFLSQTHSPASAAPGEMDDWFITPRIKLTAGKNYRFTIPQYLHPAMEIAVTYGDAPQPESLTGIIIPTTAIVTATDWDALQQDFTVTETGEYYVAIHAVNTASATRGLYIRDHFSIEEIGGENVPQAPTQLTATAGEKGAKTVHFTVKAPDKTVHGDDITSPLTMNIRYRNRIVVSKENVAPGQTVEADYANEYIADGYAEFSVTAANSEGNSAAATTQVYLGVDVPVMSGTVSVVDNIEAQTISWTPVSTRGANGFYVDPDKVEYIIYDISYGGENGEYVFYEEIARVSGTSYRYEDLTNQGEQHETFKGVRAVNQCGQSSLIRSGAFIKGTPYSLPFFETLEGGATNGKLWWTEEESTTSSPSISDDSYDINSGSFIWTAGANRESVSINTGKISLRGAANKPVVSFAYFGEVGDQTTINVYAVTPDGISHRVGESISMVNAKGDDEWRTAIADLSNYKDEEYVILKFLLTAGRRNESLKLDAIHVYNMLQYNLAVDIAAPTTLRAGTEGKVNITVRNTGDNDINAYTVKLFIDDEPFFSQAVSEPLKSQEQRVLTTIYKPSPNSEAGTVYLRAEVESSIDLDPDDDWIEAEVDIREATAATPLNVRLEHGLLTWQSPGETTEECVEQFDDFTSYDNAGISASNYTGYLNDWLVYDGDGDETQNFMVNYPGRQLFAPQAWLVWDTSTPSSEAPSPMAGSKYLISFNPPMNAADDWLISPQLSGNAQTISFQLCMMGNVESLGSIEILYTVSDFNGTSLTDFISSFHSVKTASASAQWQPVEANLPANAKYFAIRNVSNAGLGVAIDLIRYEKGRPAPVSFNVYGDGILLSSVGANEALVYSTDGTAGTYGVSALYANGEESKIVEASDPSGIHQPATSGETFDIWTPEGIKVRSRATTTDGLRKGVYIINGKTYIKK